VIAPGEYAPGVPDFTPDGSRLTAQRYNGSRYEIVVMNRDGSDLTTLFGGTSDNTTAAWSPDGTRIAFYSNRSPAGVYTARPDGSDQSFLTSSPATRSPVLDWQPILKGYPRPKGATPIYASLVPAYQACSAPNRAHAPPLSFGSCAPATQTSTQLTIGTPDANGQAAKATSYVKLATIAGNLTTPADEADLRLKAQINDVRNTTDLSDYTGSLEARISTQITDRSNTPYPGGPGPGTVQDNTVSFAIPCAASADTTVGADCNLQTTADTLVPNTITEGRRSVWQTGQVEVYDGVGQPFMRQGVFAP
jgi:hypothetical protein